MTVGGKGRLKGRDVRRIHAVRTSSTAIDDGGKQVEVVVVVDAVTVVVCPVEFVAGLVGDRGPQRRAAGVPCRQDRRNVFIEYAEQEIEIQLTGFRIEATGCVQLPVAAIGAVWIDAGGRLRCWRYGRNERRY